MKQNRIVILTISHHAKDSRLYHKIAQTLSDESEVILLVGNSKISSDENPKIESIEYENKFQFLAKAKCRIAAIAPKTVIFVEPITMILSYFLPSNIKKVYDSHEFFASAFANRFSFFDNIIKKLYQTIEKRLVQQMDLVIAVNSVHKHYLEEYGKKVIEIDNSPQTNDSAQKSIEKIYDVAYIGTISAEKGIFKLIKAIDIFLKNNQKIKIVVGGKFVNSLDEEKFMDILSQQKYKSVIDFRGYLEKDDLEEVLSKSRIGLCLLSPKVERYHWALSVKTIEYLQFGLPVITNNFPFLKERLPDEGTAFTEFSSIDLYKKIRHFLAYPKDRLEEIGKLNRQFALENYDWNDRVKKLKKAFNELNHKQKRILYLSYFFPPLGGPAVQRACKTVKYLQKNNIKVDVLTLKDILYHSYDYSLLKECDFVDIHRTFSLDPMMFLAKRKNDAKKMYFNTSDAIKSKIKKLFPIDEKIGWLPFALFKGLRLHSQKNFDAIIATIGPNSAAIIAYILSKCTNIPLIIDYRDHWTLNPFREKRWSDFFESKLEKKILTHANLITGISQTWREELISNFEVDSSKISVIYNGYDEVDYQKVFESNESKKIFSYIGNFYSLRTPRYFLQAIDELEDENLLADEIVFRFVGNYFKREQELFEKVKSDKVEIIPQVEHDEAIQMQMESDVLLLFIASKSGKGVVTGKLFEYLRTQKPILAMVPKDSEAREILQDSGHENITEMENVSEIKKLILEMVNHNKEYKIPEKLSRENQIAKLVRYVEEM